MGISIRMKALQVIEAICSDSDSIEAYLLMAKDKEIPRSLAEELTRKISDIHKYAHAANRYLCYDECVNWQLELEEVYKKLKAGGLL